MDLQPVIAAIDPGLHGGLVIIKDKDVGVFSFSDWNIFQTYELLKKYRPQILLIEDVALITPNKKIVADLAGEVGIYKGYAIALHIPFKMVGPKEWQSHYGLERCTKAKVDRGRCEEVESTTMWKNRLYEYASALTTAELSLETCDAFLIAKYGQDCRIGNQ